MSLGNRKRRRALLAILLLLALGYAGYRAFGTDADLERVKELRQELSAKDLTPEQRRAAAQRLRDALGKLSPEQRRAAGREMAQERNKRMAERLQEYARMSPREKTRHLDEQIKRMEDMRRQMQARQGTGSSPSQFGPGQGPGGGNRPAPTAAEREQWRKQRLDDTTPEFRAQLDQYRKDIQARRQQLGLPATPPRR